MAFYFWCSRSLVQKMHLHLLPLPQQISRLFIYFKQQTSQVDLAKFEKAGIGRHCSISLLVLHTKNTQLGSRKKWS